MTRLVAIGVAVTILMSAGCAATQDVLEVEIRGGTSTGAFERLPHDSLRVAVAPMEDRRPYRDQVGKRVNVWGQKTRFIVVGDDLGALVAQVVVEFLRKQKGWHAWLDRPGVAPPEGGPDVTITGRIEALTADARPKPGVTRMDARIDFILEARNVHDGRVMRVRLGEGGTRSVFQFEGDDVEDLVHTLMLQGLEQALGKISVENRALRHP